MKFLERLKQTFGLLNTSPPPTSTLQEDPHEQPVHITPKECERFHPNDPALVEHLTEFGYVVVKGVANEAEIAESIDLLWNFLESNSPMRRNDPTTWHDESFQKVGVLTTGILGYKGIGQSDFLWKLRLLDGVKEAFSNIFHTSDLITSYDGGNVFRPWHRFQPSVDAGTDPDTDTNESNQWITSSGWFHVDQGKSLRGLHCVQGLVTLTDANAKTGGFCVIPKSHLHHDALVDEAVFGERNFVVVPPSHAILNMEQVLPVCNAGDLILWDSRSVHCSTPALAPPTAPVDELLRIVGYVAMVPASKASPDIIAIREALYATNKTTSHWPHIMRFTPSPDDPVVHHIEEVSAKKRALISGGVLAK